MLGLSALGVSLGMFVMAVLGVFTVFFIFKVRSVVSLMIFLEISMLLFLQAVVYSLGGSKSGFLLMCISVVACEASFSLSLLVCLYSLKNIYYEGVNSLYSF